MGNEISPSSTGKIIENGHHESGITLASMIIGSPQINMNEFKWGMSVNKAGRERKT